MPKKKVDMERFSDHVEYTSPSLDQDNLTNFKLSISFKMQYLTY